MIDPTAELDQLQDELAAARKAVTEAAVANPGEALTSLEAYNQTRLRYLAAMAVQLNVLKEAAEKTNSSKAEQDNYTKFSDLLKGIQEGYPEASALATQLKVVGYVPAPLRKTDVKDVTGTTGIPPPRIDFSTLGLLSVGNSQGGSGPPGGRLPGVQLRDLGIQGIPQFSGDPSVLTILSFLARIEHMQHLKRWSSQEQCAVVELLCKDEARAWFDSKRELEDRDHQMFTNYTTLKKMMVQRFHVAASYAEKCSLIEKTRQTDPYKGPAFLDKCIQCAHLIWDASWSEGNGDTITRKEARVELALLLFTMGSTKELRAQIAKDESATYEEMQASLRRYQAGLRAQDTKPHENIAKGTFNISAIGEPSGEDTGEPSLVEKVDTIYKNLQATKAARQAGSRSWNGKWDKTGQDRQAQQERDRKENRCFWCHNKGHTKAECNKHKRWLARKNGDGQNETNGTDVGAIGGKKYDIYDLFGQE